MHVALQAALACGLSASELKQLIDEEAADEARQSGVLGAPWTKAPTMTPSPAEVADRSKHDILSPQPIPRDKPVPEKAPRGLAGSSEADAADPLLSWRRNSKQKDGIDAMPHAESTMSKGQLKQLAERRGLDYDVLLADAAAQGVPLRDEDMEDLCKA